MALTITDELGNTIIEVLSPDEIGNTTVEVLLPAVSGAVGPAGATGATGATGSGGEPGGLTGQVLTKASTNDYDYVWEYKYLGRFNLEAATNRALANATGVTVERYFTCTAEGNGESFNIQSNTPSVDNKIVRKIWYKNEAFETTDVNTWTLVHTFADDATYASTATQWAATLEAQTYGKPPFTLAISWEEAPAFVALFDVYPGGAMAYALHRLRTSYAGSAIRVRRASDNAEQDIGFAITGDLDTGALTSFCAGTNGFIKTWYNQGSATANLTQTTTANQPKVYDSATGVITRNGKAAALFNGSTSNIGLDSAQSRNPAPLSMFTVNERVGSGINQIVAGQVERPQQGYITTNRFQLRIAGGSYNTTNVISGQVVTATVITAANTATIHINGASEFSGAVASIGIDDRFSIGSYNTSATTQAFNGYIQAVIYYRSDQSANRAAIETNILDYFNI